MTLTLTFDWPVLLQYVINCFANFSLLLPWTLNRQEFIMKSWVNDTWYFSKSSALLVLWHVAPASPCLTVHWPSTASVRRMRPYTSALPRTVQAPLRPALVSQCCGPTGCLVFPRGSGPAPSHPPPSRCRGTNPPKTHRTSSATFCTSARQQVCGREQPL